MKRIYQASALLLIGLLGCHAGLTQVPQPSTEGIQLTCQAPASCTASGAASCQYVFARATCLTATSCPANTAGNSSFIALNQTSPSGLTYLDQTPLGNSIVVFTCSSIQDGLTSLPSPLSNTVTVPAQPGAPGAPTATEQAALAPPLLPDAKPAPAFAKKPSPPAGLVATLLSERTAR